MRPQLEKRGIELSVGTTGARRNLGGFAADQASPDQPRAERRGEHRSERPNFVARPAGTGSGRDPARDASSWKWRTTAKAFPWRCRSASLTPSLRPKKAAPGWGWPLPRGLCKGTKVFWNFRQSGITAPRLASCFRAAHPMNSTVKILLIEDDPSITAALEPRPLPGRLRRLHPGAGRYRPDLRARKLVRRRDHRSPIARPKRLGSRPRVASGQAAACPSF